MTAAARKFHLWGRSVIPTSCIAAMNRPGAVLGVPALAGRTAPNRLKPGHRTRGGSWKAVILLSAITLSAAMAFAAESPLAEWTFDRAGDLQGWQPNGHLADVAVTNGTLSCRATGSDPILELRPLLDFKASPWQVVEIRLKADHDGVAELFWSNTSTGRYGGFSQEKSTRFNVTGDSQWHTYRLLPGWHPEGKIVRLRFDLCDGARFELDSLRVLELTMPPLVAVPIFDFNKGNREWQLFDTSASDGQQRSAETPPRPQESWAGDELRATPSRLLLSPPLRIDAAEQNFASIRMAVDRGQHATLFFLTEKDSGLHSFTFPIQADGKERTYNLDLLAAKDWQGKVIGLGLRPSDATNATAMLRSLAISDVPKGPPQLKVVSFAAEDALPRVGSPVKLVVWVQNTGGETATSITASLSLPAEVKMLSDSTAVARVADEPEPGVLLFWRDQSLRAWGCSVSGLAGHH